MKKLFSFAPMLYMVSLAVAPAPLYAQVHVEEEVTTDTVDLFAKSETPEKSAAIAMCANLLLPGLGHYYLGNQKAAFGYFAVELALIFGAYTTNQYSNEIARSAHSFASTYADIQGGAGADDFFWQNVGLFMDSDGLNQSRSLGYNQVQELNRTPQAEYLTPNLQWRWVSDEYRQKYNEYLNTSINFKVASNFFIGAMALDRLIAFIDARVAAHHNGKGIFSSLHVVPQYSTNGDRRGLMFCSEF
ncbi:MAG: hypothetical protein WBM07_12935 [Chitinivibrionales bacterium]